MNNNIIRRIRLTNRGIDPPIAITWRLNVVEKILECAPNGMIGLDLSKEIPYGSPFSSESNCKTRVYWSSE